jgi:hypothetical protein
MSFFPYVLIQLNCHYSFHVSFIVLYVLLLIFCVLYCLYLCVLLYWPFVYKCKDNYYRVETKFHSINIVPCHIVTYLLV